ncbi:MAG: hypothetical protein ACLTJB_11325, partial [Holdemania filiformis]
GKCLALDEVPGNDVEIGLPSSPNGIYEIDIARTSLWMNLRINMNSNICLNFILTNPFCKM